MEVGAQAVKRLRAALARAWNSPLRPDLRDVHIYGGLLAVAIGIAFMYWPAAPVAAGVGLLYLGLWRVR